MSAAACEHQGGCLTCGDVGLRLTVVSVDARTHLAVCEADNGAREEVDASLVEPLAEGDTVLVHARVALARLDAPNALAGERAVERQASEVA